MSFKTRNFSYKNRAFEIRAVNSNNEIKIRLFENGRPASPISYNVDIETAFDAKMSGFPLDLVDMLMDQLEAETTSGRLRLYPL